MSIVISDKTKNRILQFINNNRLESSFNSSFIEKTLQDLENNNELNEYVARKVLEEIYQRGRNVRNIVTPDKEFELRFTEAFASYDDIPKTDDYGTFENNDLSEEQIVQSIETCFELTELSDEYYTARDTRKIAHEAIKSIEFLKKNGIEVSSEKRPQKYSDIITRKEFRESEEKSTSSMDNKFFKTLNSMTYSAQEQMKSMKDLIDEELEQGLFGQKEHTKKRDEKVERIDDDFIW